MGLWFPKFLPNSTGNGLRLRSHVLVAYRLLGGGSQRPQHCLTVCDEHTLLGLKGANGFLSRHKYSLVISSFFPGRHTGPTRQELSDCLKSGGLSLIKDHCLYRMSLMFFWQESDIVTISCFLSMQSAGAVRLSNIAQGEQWWAILQRTPYV